MKHILMVAALAFLLVGCKSNSRNSGTPGDPNYSETGTSQPAQYPESQNDRHTGSKVSNNLRGPIH